MNKPLKICMVTTFYPPHNFGGDGIYIQRLTQALRSRGHHVEILYNPFAYKLMSQTTSSERPLVGSTLLSGSRINTLLMQQTGHPMLQRREIKSFLEQDWDVINFHNTSLIGGPHILSYGHAVKLYTVHEYWLVCPMHLLLKNGKTICKKQSCITCSLAHKKPPQFWRYTNAIQKNIQYVDEFISPSRFSAELHQNMGIDKNFTAIPNFVPRQELATWENTPPYFLYVGRLERLKGLHDILPIFKKRTDFTLKIIGRGTCETELKKIAAGAKNIEFLGYKNQKELQSYYRNAQALILPSICYEVSGQVILEAYQQKTPAIVRNVGGMPEHVYDNHAGLVFNTRDELEQSLATLSNLQTREKMGLNGYNSLKQKYNENNHIQKYLDIIYRLDVKRHRSGL